MINQKIKVHFHSKQGAVWKALQKYRFVVLVAGRRFGKTILAVIVLIISALSHKDSLYWYVAPTYRQAKMIAWRMLKGFVSFLDVKLNESELSVTFPNGAIIELKGAENEDALRGTGLNGLVIDEFAVIFNNWLVWNEVLRPALTDKKGWTLFIGTPKGKDALFELFLKGQRGEDNYKSFQFRTLDNPYIDPEEVEQAKKELPDRYFRQEYEASFEDYVGLVWPEFTRSHIIEPYYIQKVYSKLGTIDPAITGVSAALKGFVDENGVLIIYSEFYEANVRVSEVARQIKEDDVRWWIDPASQAKTSFREGKLYSLYDEYADYGIRAYPAENDVESGINRVGEYFKTDRIKIFSNCTNLINELERYHWAKERETARGMVKPLPYKKNDHLCDCLKYMVAAKVGKADLTEPDEVSPISPLGKLREMQRMREE